MLACVAYGMGVLVAGGLSLAAFMGWAWLSDRSSRRQWRKSLTSLESTGPRSVWR